MTSSIVDRGGGGSRKMTARDTIIQALDWLESENEQLQNLNNRIQTEMCDLERENQRLRNELQQMKNERHGFKSHIEEIENTNSELHHEVGLQSTEVAKGNKIIYELRNKSQEERAISLKQMEDLNNLILQREDSVKRAERETEALKHRLERTARKNYNDRDIELLHEVEMLKEEKKDISIDKEELSKINKKLKNELSNLEVALDEKDSEMKNEGRRHALLTKEFNSLLDENNRLKLQMRRKHSQSQTNLASPSIEHFDETISELPENPATARSGVPKQSMAREPSLIINNEVFQPTRDYPFSSREKFSISRMPSMTPREPSLVKKGGNFSVRDGKKGGRPTAAKPDDRTTPDTLPSLGNSSAKGSKSK